MDRVFLKFLYLNFDPFLVSTSNDGSLTFNMKPSYEVGGA